MKNPVRRLFARLDSKGRQALLLIGVNGLFWFAWAFGCYQTVYLHEIGFAASQLGLLNAISSGVGIASVAFWGMVSDRIGSLRRVLMVLLLCAGVLYALVPNLPTAPGFLLMGYLPLVNFFRGPTSTFAENLLVRNCNELELNFGTLRGAGSLLFTVGSLIISALLPTVEVRNTFRITGLLMIPAIVCTVFAREPSARRPQSGGRSGPRAPDPRVLFRDRSYRVLLVFAFLLNIAAACEGNFIPYFMESAGVSSMRYGVVLAYRALLEIPFLLLMARLRRRFPLRALIAAAALLMGAECLGFGLFAKGLGTMLLFCTFFGLGNGLFIGSSLNYVYELAPSDLKATAQAFYAATASVAGILGNLLGGMVFDAIGAKPFYLAVSGMYALAAGVFVLSFGGKRQKGEGQEAGDVT